MYDLVLYTFLLVQAIYTVYLAFVKGPRVEEELNKLRVRVAYFHEHIDQMASYQKEYTDGILNEFSQQLNSVNQAWADELEVRFQGLEYMVAELSKSALSQDVTYLSQGNPSVEKIKATLQESSGLRHRFSEGELSAVD
jgi:hypothetical protein